MYVHVCIGSTDESQHRLSMWQHVLEACIKHSHEMGEKRDMMQPHGGGRMEEKYGSMHMGCASSTAMKKALP